jgi:hypothetical protein
MVPDVLLVLPNELAMPGHDLALGAPRRRTRLSLVSPSRGLYLTDELLPPHEDLLAFCGVDCVNGRMLLGPMVSSGYFFEDVRYRLRGWGRKMRHRRIRDGRRQGHPPGARQLSVEFEAARKAALGH